MNITVDTSINKVSESSDFNYIDDARKTAKFVRDSIVHGKLSDISTNLNNLPEKKQKENYVFSHPNSSLELILIFFFGALGIIFIFFLITSFAIFSFSSEFFSYGIIGFIISALLIIIDAVIILFIVLQKRFYRRYRKYENILKHCGIELVENIAVYSKEPVNLVSKDIKKSVKLKFVPQGHFGTDNLIFIISDKAYNIYQENQAAYDKCYRKLADEYAHMGERTDEIQEIMDSGNKKISEIREYNKGIKDKLTAKKLIQVEQTVSIIFNELDINPSQTKTLEELLNYYLTSITNLLKAYAKLSEAKENGKRFGKTQLQSDIEQAIDTVNSVFDGILDKYYQEKEMKIFNDITAMK